jgi:hypothetical protein
MNGGARSSLMGASSRLVLVLLVMALVAPACKPKAVALPPVGTTQTQPQTTTSPQPGQSQPSPTERDEEPSNAPQSGAADDLFSKQVGPFEAQRAQRDPAAIQSVGAVDILDIIYEDTNGRQVFHQISVFSSNQDAGNALGAVLNRLTKEKGYTVASRKELTNNQQEVIGTEFRLNGRHTVHAWNNLRLVAIVESADESAVNDFISQLRY